ncbi:ABC transporter substrate-binding protein [Nocardia concava]|uniref:ABC transporter substrate-binding protein n=1 Tax=Nocardia concava TaxID=257281 RepID=UPI0002EFC933|nr:ABC transporter substrate-binding protein [Nocardia concava]
MTARSGWPLAAALTVALIAGCSSGATGAGGDSAGPPVEGGTVRFALPSEPSCLDPGVSPADATALIDRGVVDSLVAQGKDNAFKPWLATGWKISDDLKSYVFTLRDDVVFHDGTKLDAAAVKANFDRIADPNTKSQWAATLLGPYARSTVLDEHTVQVDFSEPFQPFLAAASTTALGIQSPKNFADNAGKLCDHVVGSGPFTFTGHIAQQNVTLAKNPGYRWAPETAAHTGPAHLDGVEFRFVPENSTRIGALTSGQIDGLLSVPAQNVGDLKSDPGLAYNRYDGQGAVYAVYINTQRGPWKDPRVRRALQRSTDVDAILSSIYFGTYARAWSILAPATQFYEAALENSWNYNIDEANRLLDEAGWNQRDSEGYRVKDGVRLTARWTTTKAQDESNSRGLVGLAITASAKKAGIEIVRNNVQTGQLFQQVAAGDYDLFDTSWSSNSPDILRSFLLSTAKPMAGQNISWVQDPQVDGWVSNAARTLDPDTQRRDYAAAQKWAIDQAVVIPVFVPASQVATSTRVHGVAAAPSSYPVFYDAWLK